MRVLVTGGGGFIGAWVVRRLLALGAQPRVMDLGEDRSLLEQVIGTDSSGIEWASGDISRREDLEIAMSGCERVIHLAGALGPLCQTNPARAAEINYVGTLHLFTLASASSMPVVYASTALVHASDGDQPAAPGGHYGIFKHACEMSAHLFSKSHRLSSVGIRPPVVYGFGRTAGNSAGLSLACRAAALGEAYTIPMSGEVEAIYVCDVAATFVAAALAPCEGAFVGNLNGTRISLEEFEEAIRTVEPGAAVRSGGYLHAIAHARPGLDIAPLFPGIPKTSLVDGVADTIQYHRSGVPPVVAGS